MSPSNHELLVGSRDGVRVIALASHLRGPGSGHEWIKLVFVSLLCFERFFSEFSGFPLSSKINISKFQFDRMKDLPENQFRASGNSWVNISNYYYYYYSLFPSFFGSFQLNTYLRTMVSITSHPSKRKLENPKIIVFDGT